MKSHFWVIEAGPVKSSGLSCVENLNVKLDDFIRENQNNKVISISQSSIQKGEETHIVLTICYE